MLMTTVWIHFYTTHLNHAKAFQLNSKLFIMAAEPDYIPKVSVFTELVMRLENLLLTNWTCKVVHNERHGRFEWHPPATSEQIANWRARDGCQGGNDWYHQLWAAFKLFFRLLFPLLFKSMVRCQDGWQSMHDGFLPTVPDNMWTLSYEEGELFSWKHRKLY